MEFEKRENITLIVVLIISAVVFGTWGITKLTRPPEERQSDDRQPEYYYKCTVEPYDWPDLIMELEFNRDFTPEEKREIAENFFELYNEYNERAVEKGEYAIHYIDVYDDTETDKNLSFYIDFGNTDMDALEMFLNYLDQHTTEVKKVYVY